ncbi:MAG TPA: hypothetical protein ENF41_01660 [Candidatus Bathyarchaeota archaeon]|nr:hypothetical protein [Candidatus Bathyarchaeota archaeon]
MLIPLLGAVYAIASLIPLNVILGSSGSITLNIIITPLIVLLTKPKVAVLSGFLGGVLSGYLPTQSPHLPFIIFKPVAGTLIGGISKGERLMGLLLASLYLSSVTILFYVRNFKQPFVTLLYLLGVGLLFLRNKIRKLEDYVVAYVSTISEHGYMCLYFTYIIPLPPEIFTLALPFTVIERSFATFLSVLLAKGIRSRLV